MGKLPVLSSTGSKRGASHHGSLCALVVAVVLAMIPGIGAAQTAQVLPTVLRQVPTTGAIYWQQLQVSLDHPNAASDSAIIVNLPHGVLVHDADADGAVFDEIRVVYVGAAEAPGLAASTRSTTSRIVVRSLGPANAGDTIYLQFPILVSVPPSGTATRYEAILFADDGEGDLIDEADLPVLSFVSPEEFAVLGSMGIVSYGPAFASQPDTAVTSAVGTTYPDSGAAIMVSLPDLVFDSGVGDPNRRPGWGDGDDANDTEYTFYFSPASSLAIIDSSAIPARTADGALLILHEGSDGEFQLLTRDLPAGTYYLYTTATVTGKIPLGRSRPLRVRHDPDFEDFGRFGKPLTFDSGGLYDEEGIPNGRGTRRLKRPLSFVDHDDDATIHLYYSGNPNLDVDDINLGKADPITTPAGLPEESLSFTWDTTHPQIVPVGDYYLYAVAAGGQGQVLARSDHTVTVRHTPFLRLDPLDDASTSGPHTIVTGGSRPQRYVTFTWGRRGLDGDGDADDNAHISLYYSDSSDFEIPGGAEAIAVAAADPGRDTHLIGTKREDPDTRLDNQLVWDLADSDATAPTAGKPYFVYGVIADSTDARLVRMDAAVRGDSGAAVTFSHPPTIRPGQPLADLEIRAGHSGRVSWDDMDLDDDARIRVILSAEDHGEVATYDEVTGGADYIVNSADGRAAATVDSERDLSEDSAIDYIDVRWDHLKRGMTSESAPLHGHYYVYLAIEDGPAFGPETLAWRARGQIELSRSQIVIGDPDGTGSQGSFALWPEAFSLGTGGRRQEFELLVDADESPVDLVLATLVVDGSRFEVVDRDSTREGVQPFVVGSGFPAAKLTTNAAEVSAEGNIVLRLEYFDPTLTEAAKLDGDHPLAGFELVSLDQEGLAFILLVAAIEDGGLSQLELSGAIVVEGEFASLSTGALFPGRASIHGSLALEGRDENTALVDFSLRRWAEYEPLDDSLFAAANDADPTRSGVQVELDSEGSFELLEVPTGRLDLFAHLDGYLDAWHRGLDLFPDQLVEDVHPTSGGGPTDSLVLGGDVAGYTEEDGQCRPDNEVTLADWDYLASVFGRTLASGEDSARADITGDGIVNIRDLSLVGANFLRRGPQPVYKPLPMPNTDVVMTTGWVEENGAGIAAGDIVSVVAAAGPLNGVRSFELDLRFEADHWQRLETQLAHANALVAERDQPWGTTVAATLPGRHGDFAEVAGGDGGARAPLVYWRLRARVPDPHLPGVSRAVALDLADRQVPVQLLDRAQRSSDSEPALPNCLSLHQNYPNPFNPETTLVFSLPPLYAGALSHSGGSAAAAYSVRLDIYDALGQQVTVLTQGELSPGVHGVSWNGLDASGRAVASGVYLYRLVASVNGDSHQVVRRMLLLR